MKKLYGYSLAELLIVVTILSIVIGIAVPALGQQLENQRKVEALNQMLGVLGYTRSKAVLYDGNSGKIEANWYPYTQKKYHLFANLIDTLFGKSGIARLLGLIKTGTALEGEAKKPRG